MPKPIFTLAFCLAFSAAALAQKNQISIIGSVHRYSSDFFLNQEMKNNRQSLSTAGNYKFSAGLALDMAYSESKIYNGLFRLEYALRSYSTQETFSISSYIPGTEFIGHYIDISMGLRRMKPISDKKNFGFGLYAGAGVPWFTSNLKKKFSGSDVEVIDQTLPFVEANLTLSNTVEKKDDDGWAIDYSFFARGYFTPAYQRSEEHDPAPPYLAFGLTLKAGHVKY